MRLAWRLDALDKWRESVDDDLAGCRKDLDGVMSADAMHSAIQSAVSQALRQERSRIFSLPQKAAAVVLFLIVSVPGVVNLVHSFH